MLIKIIPGQERAEEVEVELCNYMGQVVIYIDWGLGGGDKKGFCSCREPNRRLEDYTT
jgi:hypothetical protein